MPQRGQPAIDGMEKPEAGNLLGRHPALLAVIAARRARKRGAFLGENIHQPPGHSHQRLAGAKAQYRRDELLIEDEMSCAVAEDAGHRKQLQAIALFALEHEPDVLPSEANRLFLAAAYLVEYGVLLGNEPGSV